MNRIFGITGFFAAGMTLLWGWFVIGLPWWIPIYGSRGLSMPPWAWLLWGAVSAVGIAVVFAFFRRSLKDHWAALRHNAPMSSAAWRGVCGVYLLVMLALALPFLKEDPSGTHQTERYLYTGLVGCCLALAVLAARRGFSHCTHDSRSTVA